MFAVIGKYDVNECAPHCERMHRAKVLSHRPHGAVRNHTVPCRAVRDPVWKKL